MITLPKILSRKGISCLFKRHCSKGNENGDKNSKEDRFLDSKSEFELNSNGDENKIRKSSFISPSKSATRIPLVAKINDTDIECPECEFRTKSVSSLIYHLRIKHSTNHVVRDNNLRSSILPGYELPLHRFVGDSKRMQVVNNLLALMWKHIINGSGSCKDFERLIAFLNSLPPKFDGDTVVLDGLNLAHSITSLTRCYASSIVVWRGDRFLPKKFREALLTKHGKKSIMMFILSPHSRELDDLSSLVIAATLKSRVLTGDRMFNHFSSYEKHFNKSLLHEDSFSFSLIPQKRKEEKDDKK